MLRNGLSNERILFGVWLLIAGAVLACFHLQPGWPRMGDGHGLLSQTWLFRESLREGGWPNWTFFWYGGWSFTRAYGPLFPAIPGALDLFLLNPKRSVVLVVFGYRLLGLAASYLCARGLGLGPRGALFASLVYTFCGQQGQSILRYGEFNLSLFYALAPLPLFFLARGMTSGALSSSNALLAALFQAALFLNHFELGVYAWVGTLSMTLLFLGVDRPELSTRKVQPILVFAILPILLAFFFLIQFLVTREFTLLGRETFDYFSRPNFTPITTLFDSDYSDSHSWSIQYFGLPSALLLLVGGAVALRQRSAWGMASLLALASFIALLLFVGRYRMLNFLVLPASLLVGMGVETLDRWLRDRTWMKGRKIADASVLVLLAAGLLADHCRLLPMGQFSYRPTVGYFESMPTEGWFMDKARNEGVFGRTLQIRPSLEAAVWTDMEPLVTGHPTLAGGNLETAPKIFPYTAAFMEVLIRSVHRGIEPSIDLQDFALLFGLRFLAHPREVANPIDWGEVIPHTELFHCIELAHYSPILASRSATLWQAESPLDRLPGSRAWKPSNLDLSQLEWIQNRMGVERDSLTCRTLLFREAPSTEIEPPTSEEKDFRLDFLSERVGHHRTVIEFETTHPCYLRTTCSFDPRLEFLLDGERVDAFPTAMHFAGLVCPTAGKHHLEIRAIHLPIERFGGWVSLASWIGCLVFLARPAKRAI